MQFYTENISSLPRAELIAEDKDHLSSVLKKHKLSDSEYRLIKSILHRPPTFAELSVFSAMWSEHCSYKSSKVHLKRFPTTGKNVVVGPGENAGVVRLSGKLCAVFKMESHNHPSFIEPYQGAATGVGGILRDVFCMGARPIANLNCLRFGNKTHQKTSYLLPNVVKGIGDYGNCVGIPTVGGNISFHDSYNGNILVNAMTVGLIHEDKIFKGYASGVGNLVVYVGSPTGRDGIHGATMASDSFSSEEKEKRSTVQVGDPFLEKLLLEATLEALEQNLVVGLQDMGAAGLTSSSFEMANRAGNGLFINLDRVPVRAKGMSAYEILLSESQERMLMVVTEKNWSALEKIFKKWQLHYGIIGAVTDHKNVQIVYQNQLHVDMPQAGVTENAPKYQRPLAIKPVKHNADQNIRAQVSELIKKHSLKTVLTELLKHSGSTQKIYQQYDHHIGTKSVLTSEEKGAAVLWLRSELVDNAHLGLVIATACNERYCHNDPKHGATLAVLKCAQMIAATGGEPLAITDCLNYGNPEDEKVMGQFSQGIDGISEACEALGIPVVSGNVSFYNETDGKSIFPTPMIGMVGRHHDVRRALPAATAQRADLYLFMGTNSVPRYGGSLFTHVFNLDHHTDLLPAIDWLQELEAMSFLKKISAQPAVLAARDVGQGGILLGCTKLSIHQAFKIELLPLSGDDYFGELSGAYIIAVDKHNVEGMDIVLNKAMQLKYNALRKIGETEPGALNVQIDRQAIPYQYIKDTYEQFI